MRIRSILAILIGGMILIESNIFVASVFTNLGYKMVTQSDRNPIITDQAIGHFEQAFARNPADGHSQIGLAHALGKPVILIKNIGVLGAPIAISVGAFISFLFSYYYANKILKIKSYLMHAFKPFLASLLAFGVINMIEIDSFFMLLSSVILGVLIYLFVMVLIKGITKEDMKSLKI